MTANLDAGDQKAARDVADLVKAGKDKEVGNILADDYLAMGKGGGKFGEFLKQVAADNADDLKTNDHLPGFEFGPDHFGNLRANVTSPGAILGNLWRDKDEVFAAITTQGMYVGRVGGGESSGNETAVADTNSILHASGNVRVIAEDKSYVDATWNTSVEAKSGSYVVAAVGAGNEKPQVTAEAGSRVWASFDSEVTAESGSGIYADHNAHVTAEKGSQIAAYDKSQVTAETGSLVFAHDRAQVLAKSGSYIIVDGNPVLNVQKGANVISTEQAKKMLGN